MPSRTNKILLSAFLGALLIAGALPGASSASPLAFAQANGKIVFASNQGQPAQLTHPPNIWVMNGDGSQQRLLALSQDDFCGGAGQPQWSPNGKQVVYTEFDCDSTSSLRVVNEDGSGNRLLVDRPGGIETNARWSPDGNTIAFISETGDVDTGLYVVGADGKGEKFLHPMAVWSSQDASKYEWTGDSRGILFLDLNLDWSKVVIRFVDVGSGSASPSGYDRTLMPEAGWARTPDGAYMTGFRYTFFTDGEANAVQRSALQGQLPVGPLEEFQGNGLPKLLLDPSWTGDNEFVVAGSNVGYCKLGDCWLGGSDIYRANIASTPYGITKLTSTGSHPEDPYDSIKSSEPSYNSGVLAPPIRPVLAAVRLSHKKVVLSVPRGCGTLYTNTRLLFTVNQPVDLRLLVRKRPGKKSFYKHTVRRLTAGAHKEWLTLPRRTRNGKYQLVVYAANSTLRSSKKTLNFTVRRKTSGC